MYLHIYYILIYLLPVHGYKPLDYAYRLFITNAVKNVGIKHSVYILFVFLFSVLWNMYLQLNFWAHGVILRTQRAFYNIYISKLLTFMLTLGFVYFALF